MRQALSRPNRAILSSATFAGLGAAAWLCAGGTIPAARRPIAASALTVEDLIRSMGSSSCSVRLGWPDGGGPSVVTSWHNTQKY